MKSSGIACLNAVVLGLALGLVSCGSDPEAGPASQARSAGRAPRLRPDYRDLVVPPNLAPLNCLVEEPGRRFRFRLHAQSGVPLEWSSSTPEIRFPRAGWKALLAANAGGALYLDLWAQDEAGAWTRFHTVTNQVARETVDPTLVYRLLRPLYNLYTQVGIYQRDLEGFGQKPVLENRDFGGGCLNCHTTLNRRPDQFVLHIRGQSGPQPMLLARSNEVTRVNQTAGYISWHPSGRLLAFSVNKLSLFYHTIGETRDVFDADSNLSLYLLESNRVVTPPPLALPDRLETWPSWSPDGRYLYYCSAPKLKRERHRQVRYDLMRVSYRLEDDAWGAPERLVDAAETGLSAAQPRVSPDGRWLLFCLCKYGHFPVYQPSSDLYLMDLQTLKFHRLDINSDQSDSWHCWSSNSRWVVFSSKRADGLFARPHFSYVDADGRFHRPFVLPQEDPTFYDACLHTFNLPEFVQGEIPFGAAQLARAVVQPGRVLTPEGGAGQQHQQEQSASLPPADAAESPVTDPPR